MNNYCLKHTLSLRDVHRVFLNSNVFGLAPALEDCTLIPSRRQNQYMMSFSDPCHAYRVLFGRFCYGGGFWMQLLREEEYQEGQDYFLNISMGLFEKSLFPWMPVSEAFLLEHDMLRKLKRKKTAFRCRLKEGLSKETVYETASRHNHTGLDLPPLDRMEFQGSGSCYRLTFCVVFQEPAFCTLLLSDNRHGCGLKITVRTSDGNEAEYQRQMHEGYLREQGAVWEETL